MHPIICTIGPFNVYSYGFMLAVAFLISSSLAVLQAKKQNINPDIVFNLSFIAFVAGIIGARAFYITENISYYLRNPVEIIMFQRGGLSWFGGLLAGTICAVIYLQKKKIPIYKILDLMSPFVALGQAIGRIGCLLNGCCYGKVSVKYGVYFQIHDAFLIPTQLYSALVLFMGYLVLRFLQERSHKAGEVFFAYLLLYSTSRFIIEFWRADNEVIALGLTLFQFLSIAIFCIALWKFILIKKSRN
ncbi:MAG: prolipoprotein diacylglyceryl transferase [Candidatus Omnitrophica bacterium]|nr:prolipoprotein diacylglyceryl transferase [Candidatus Omnitrophota bacterium]